MRNEFTKPVMSISTFDTENIVTISGKEFNGEANATALSDAGYVSTAATYDAVNNVLSFN